MLKTQKAVPVIGAARISIVAGRQNARRDIDNIVKPILDLLVTHKVLIDDRMVQFVSAQWGDVEGVRVTVEQWQ